MDGRKKQEHADDMDSCERDSVRSLGKNECVGAPDVSPRGSFVRSVSATGPTSSTLESTRFSNVENAALVLGRSNQIAPLPRHVVPQRRLVGLQRKLSSTFGELSAKVNEKRKIGASDSAVAHAQKALARRKSTITVQVQNELKLVKKNLWSRKPWRDGAHVMGLVIVNTLVALALAWATAFLYVVGAPWKPILPSATSSANRPPPTQVRLFSDAVVVYFVVLVSCGHLSMRAYMLSRASVPGMAIHSFVRNFVRVLASTSHVLILIAAIAIGFMELLLYIQVPLRTAGQFHLYVFFTLPLFYENYATRTSRIIHRRRVSEQCGPNASNSSLSSNSDSPMANAPRVEARTRRQRSALAHRIMGQLAFYVSFLYIFASSKIPRKADFEVLMYACGSLLLKILMQEAAKHIQLHDRMPSSTAIHYALMVPTVALDVQIRMAFLPSGKLQMQSAMMNSTAIVAGGAIFRIAKILRLRYVISSRLTKSRGMQRILKRVNSKLALKDLNVARNEYARFLDWKNYMLRVHAAEVYADMHGEYISIGCSTAAIVLFSGHPMYAIMVTPEQVTNQVIAATFQTCAGLVFDYVSSVIEGVHEVPLYESIDDEGRALRLFLRVILGALAVINIGVIALANVNEAILHQDS